MYTVNCKVIRWQDMAVNSYIPTEFSKVTYENLDHIVALVQEFKDFFYYDICVMLCGVLIIY